MAYRWVEKTVYIRETTDGKTKWVKLDGVKARLLGKRIEITLSDFEEEKGLVSWRGEEQKIFVSKRD